MPHCTNCGTEVAADAQFCPKCGQPQSAAVSGTAARPSPAYIDPPASTGMAENVAAALSYVLGWLTGIIFFLIDKRPFVRFHAAQSIVTFGGLHIIRIILGMAFGFGFWYGGLGGFGIGWLLISLLGLLSLILWIVCIIKAFQGQRFVVPIAGPIAENLAGR